MALERIGSEEEAATLALSLIREPGVADLNDTASKSARVTRKWFATVRTEVLRREDWNFAAAWMSPAADAATGIGELLKRYPLPADCLKVRYVTAGPGLAGARLEADEWAVENAAVDVGGVQADRPVLVAAIDTPIVCYTRDVTNVRLWDPLFVTAFAAQLAAYSAGEFGKSFAEFNAAAEDRIEKGAKIDAREKAPVAPYRETSWLRARSSFPSRWGW